MKNLACASILLLGACGGSNNNSVLDGGGNADLTMPGGQADLANAPMVALSGLLSAAGGAGGNNTPLAGATVKVVGASPAIQTTTGNDGSWTLMVAQGATVFISATASTYVDGETGVVAIAGGVSGINFNLIATADLATVATAVGVTIDPAKGLLVVDFHGGNSVGGFGATLSAAHDPSFAFDAGGNPMTSNTTIASGDNSLIFPNVISGMSTVTLSTPAGHYCTTPSVTNWRVDANTFTFVDVQCQ